MENVVLTVHLILALLLIGIVLLQRSEGGGLGLGGGGGSGGVMTGRQAANALSRLTWILAAAFLVTSISLTIIAARNATGGSVLDQIGANTRTQSNEGGAPGLPTYAPPPGVGAPISPPAPEAAAPAESAAPAAVAPATEAPAETAPATSTSAPADGPVAPPAAN